MRNLLLFLLVKSIVHVPITRRTQFIHILWRTLFKPILGSFQSVLKLFVFKRRTNLFKYNLKHLKIEVDDRAKLNYQSHWHRRKFSAFNSNKVHNCLCLFVGSAVFDIVVHLVKLKILSQYTVVKTKIKCLERFVARI